MADIDNAHLKKILSGYFKDSAAASCPAEEILCAYIHDALAPEERDDVERHLSRCEKCLHTALITARLGEESYEPGEADVPEQVRQRALALVPAQKIFSSGRIAKQTSKRAASFFAGLADLFSSKSPEYVYIRGSKKVISKNLVVLEKIFNDIKLEIEIEKTGTRAADIKVLTTDPKGGALFQGLRITIGEGSRELASYVASGGKVLFEGIAFGEYRLIAWRNNDKLGEVRLTIKE
ncbi:MAG: zf-HC2 domain-containing protein [Pseudomonadota bacterium]